MKIKNKQMRKAFSMMELIFVIIVIAAIAAITIPKLISNSDKTNINQAVNSDITSIINAASEWRRVSADSKGDFTGITTASIVPYLPSNMPYNSSTDCIESSGFNHEICYKIEPRKDTTNGDYPGLSIYVDGSKAAEAYSWSNRMKNYFEKTVANAAKNYSKDQGTIDIEYAANGFSSDGKFTTSTASNKDNDAKVGVGDIRF